MNWVDAVLQGVLLGGVFAISAIGLSLLFGVMRIVNLAHGALMVLAAYLAVLTLRAVAVPTLLAVLFTVPVMAAVGYVTQRTLFERALRIGPLAPLLVTFGLAVIVPNGLLELFSQDTEPLPIGSLATRSVPLGADLSAGLFPMLTLLLAVALVVGLQLFLGRTPTGRLLRAAADDTRTLRLMGVDARRIYGLATAIAFATIAIAGGLYGVRQGGVTPFEGDLVVLFAFETVIIGGLGSLWGTLAGGVVLGVAQAVGAQVSPELPLLSGHLVFLAVLALRPNGLFGRSTYA